MQEQLSNMKAAADAALLAADSLQALEEVRIRFLGKKGGANGKRRPCRN